MQQHRDGAKYQNCKGKTRPALVAIHLYLLYPLNDRRPSIYLHRACRIKGAENEQASLKFPQKQNNNSRSMKPDILHFHPPTVVKCGKLNPSSFNPQRLKHNIETA